MNDAALPNSLSIGLGIKKTAIIKSINDNNFGNNPHIHIGGK